jgi:hypothetical protein
MQVQTTLKPVQPPPSIDPASGSTPSTGFNLAAWTSSYDLGPLSPGRFLHDFQNVEFDLIDHMADLPVPGTMKAPVANDVCNCKPTCQSPLPWIAAWCMREVGDSVRHTLMTKRSLLVPSIEVIQALFESYFIYLNISTPCVSEWDTFQLLDKAATKSPGTARPMSLALLNAIMFAASGVSTTGFIITTRIAYLILVCLCGSGS